MRPCRLAACLALMALAAQGCFGNGRFLRPGVQSCVSCTATLAQLDARVVLIGDAGENYGQTDTLLALTRLSSVAPERTTVIFLGDNVYPRGVPPPAPEGESLEAELASERENAEEILQTQVDAVENSGAEAVFIPGNHDWARGEVTGVARVRAEEDLLDALATDPRRVRLQPRNACPGPVILDRGRSLRVIVVDTVWLLAADRPRGEEGCFWGTEEDPQPLEPADRERFFQALLESVEGAGSRSVLFAAHHPFRTRGPHGGYFTVQEFLFPFTLLKRHLYIPVPFLYPLVRYQVVRSDEDLIGGGNEIMRRRLELVLAEASRQPVITAGGHEHSLQIFQDPRAPQLHLVSGAGSKTTPVGTTDETLFKDRDVGFMVLDYFVDGRVSVSVIEANDNESHEVVFSMWARETGE